DIREIYESYNDKLAYRCSKKNDHAKEKNAVGNENQKSNQGSTSYDTCTISGQEEEQYKEKEKYKKQQKDVADVIQFWDENGFGINNVHAKEQLLSWLDDSSFKEPGSVILKALSISCENDARRLKYIEGILKNWENESLLTVKEMENSNQNRDKQPKEQLNYNPKKDRF